MQVPEEEFDAAENYIWQEPVKESELRRRLKDLAKDGSFVHAFKDGMREGTRDMVLLAEGFAIRGHKRFDVEDLDKMREFISRKLRIVLD